VKITNRTNWRVEVYPSGPGVYPGIHIGGLEQSERQWQKDCEDIKEQIARHVDGIRDSRNNAQISIVSDKEETCSFCKLKWEENKITGEPMCCDEAVDEWKKNY
jgi:hypothetical protein